MKKILSLLVVLTLAACTSGIQSGTNTETYEGYQASGPISGYSSETIQLRQAELINALRAENGLSPLQPSAALTSAALTHARDISSQQRAWNYGSNKSTPQSRAERAGFVGVVTGEMVAETYEGEVPAVRSWLSNPITRQAILNSSANEVGIAYFMEPSGKVWWVTVIGQNGGSQNN